jgi:hypothetical protein
VGSKKTDWRLVAQNGLAHKNSWWMTVSTSAKRIADKHAELEQFAYKRQPRK